MKFTNGASTSQCESLKPMGNIRNHVTCKEWFVIGTKRLVRNAGYHPPHGHAQRQLPGA